VKLASLHLFLQRARSKPLKLLSPDGKRQPGRPKRAEYASDSAV
jgi:hypothetical protein